MNVLYLMTSSISAHHSLVYYLAYSNTHKTEGGVLPWCYARGIRVRASKCYRGEGDNQIPIN